MLASDGLDRPRGLGEVFDHAIVIVVRNAFAVGVVSCAYFALAEVVGSIGFLARIDSRFIMIFAVYAVFLPLAVILDATLGATIVRPLDAVRIGISRLPFALALAVPLALLFVLFIAIGTLGASILLGSVGAAVNRANPLVQVVFWSVPIVLLALVFAYCLAVAGLAITAIALETRSPTRAIRLTFQRLSSWPAIRRAIVLASAAGAVNAGCNVVGASIVSLLSVPLGDAPFASRALYAVMIALIGILTAPLNVAILVVFRRDLIVRREGVDLLSAIRPGAPAPS